MDVIIIGIVIFVLIVGVTLLEIQMKTKEDGNMEYDNLRVDANEYGKKSKDEYKLKVNKLMEGEGRLDIKKIL